MCALHVICLIMYHYNIYIYIYISVHQHSILTFHLWIFMMLHMIGFPLTVPQAPSVPPDLLPAIRRSLPQASGCRWVGTSCPATHGILETPPRRNGFHMFSHHLNESIFHSFPIETLMPRDAKELDARTQGGRSHLFSVESFRNAMKDVS